MKRRFSRLLSAVLVVVFAAGMILPCAAYQADDVHFPKTTSYRQGQFSDVPSNAWFTSQVADAVRFGLMKGDSVTTFNPYGNVTIAQAITMAARIHSIYTTGTERFVQDSGSKWYQVYLDYAYRNGIIGWSYYSCDVSKAATREQFAEIFAAALPDKALPVRCTVENNAIPDVPSSASYAGAVYKLYRAGILTGNDSKGTFAPKSNISRAESAAIVARMADSDNRKNISLTAPQSLTMKEYGGVWHSRDAGNGMPMEELIIHSLDNSKVSFTLSCYRLYGCENVRGTFTNSNTASFTTNDGANISGRLIFGKGKITLMVDSSGFQYIPAGTQYVFQTRSSDRFF